MNILIFVGGFLIGLVIGLFVVEYDTSRSIARLIKAMQEQSEFIDKLSKSAKDISDMNKELIETCKQFLNMLP